VPPRTVIVDAVLVVGREEGDVILEDRRVSRRHVRLTPRRDGVLLEDLGSSNGTSVNGTRVGGPLLLRGGETVRLGQTVVRVVVAARSGETVIAELPTG
jgi:pSer/pThr/pTyr-binding forkhead associated (FHA) protein